MDEPNPTELNEHNWLNYSDRRRLIAIYESPSACFSDLVQAAELNPAVDFRFSDLTGVDFSGSDLRGYNFVGANLSFTRWQNAIWDSSTILTGAELRGARDFNGDFLNQADNAPTETIAQQPAPSRLPRGTFRRFLNQTPMAIAAVDRAGTLLDTNGRYGALVTTLSGAPTYPPSILSIVHPRDQILLRNAILKAEVDGPDIAPVEVLLDSRKERWGQFFVTAVLDERETEAVIIYILETTEKRALENQLNQAQKMDTIGQLAGGIAHDFNNVLSAIMMANDFLLNSHKPTDPAFQDIMQIKQNASRAATLVRQLMAFSRKQTLRPQAIDVGDALADIDRLLKRLVGELVALEFTHARDLWLVRADISQFEQVIVNLSVNARDAMPRGGKLTIRTANVPAAETAKLPIKDIPSIDWVRIDVSDTGAGISPEIIDNIFEPFFSTKQRDQGNGLGLSTVYGIVKQSGGFIFVQSELGRGSTFSIIFPRHQLSPEEELDRKITGTEVPAISPAISSMAEAPISNMTGEGTILLVEDEDGLRSLNARGLRSRGYTVLEASDGAEALKILDLHSESIDLIVSNVVMPNIDGPTLLRTARLQFPSLRAVFVSGYAEDAVENKLPKDQEFAFLAKPFSLSALISKVKETMANT